MSTIQGINQSIPLTQATPAALEAADADDQSTAVHHPSSSSSPSGGDKLELKNEKALTEVTSHGSKSPRNASSS